MTTIQKTWFHVTTKQEWKTYKSIGFLWNPWGKVFVARNLEELLHMSSKECQNPINADIQDAEMVLGVKYIPNGFDDEDKGWELIIKKPIPIQNIKILKYL